MAVTKLRTTGRAKILSLRSDPRSPGLPMDAVIMPERQVRAHHRHDLRSLAYLTLDRANGGVVRNVTDRGIGAQLIASVRPGQQLQIRFELRDPRLRVETRGEVVWAKSSGQCGIRFLDLPPGMIRQINEWILGNLLERVSVHAEGSGSMFAPPAQRSGLGEESAASADRAASEDDGLMVSATPVKIIELPVRKETIAPVRAFYPRVDPEAQSELDWLSRPLSGRSLAWAIDGLVVLAGTLLVALVFLSVTREAPRWPVAMTFGDVLFVVGLYRGLFQMFGGTTLGTRLANLAGSAEENQDRTLGSRFR